MLFECFGPRFQCYRPFSSCLSTSTFWSPLPCMFAVSLCCPTRRPAANCVWVRSSRLLSCWARCPWICHATVPGTVPGTYLAYRHASILYPALTPAVPSGLRYCGSISTCCAFFRGMCRVCAPTVHTHCWPVVMASSAFVSEPTMVFNLRLIPCMLQTPNTIIMVACRFGLHRRHSVLRILLLHLGP